MPIPMSPRFHFSLQSETVRFLLLLCRIYMKLPGTSHMLAIPAVLQSVALAKSLNHTAHYVSGTLQLCHILLTLKDLDATRGLLRQVQRYHLQVHCAKLCIVPFLPCASAALSQHRGPLKAFFRYRHCSRKMRAHCRAAAPFVHMT